MASLDREYERVMRKKYDRIEGWFMSFEPIDAYGDPIDYGRGPAEKVSWLLTEVGEDILDRFAHLRIGESFVHIDQSIGGGTMTYTRVKRHRERG